MYLINCCLSDMRAQLKSWRQSQLPVVGCSPRLLLNIEWTGLHNPSPTSARHEEIMHVECSQGVTAQKYTLNCSKNAVFTLIMQVYIVSGGGDAFSTVASTETLEKDGGSAWQLVASLPSARYGVRGVGLDNGRFMVTGQ